MGNTLQKMTDRVTRRDGLGTLKGVEFKVPRGGLLEPTAEADRAAIMVIRPSTSFSLHAARQFSQAFGERRPETCGRLLFRSCWPRGCF